MVYGFARQSEGIAIIDSEEGAGTTVRLLIPATAATKIFSCENFFWPFFSAFVKRVILNINHANIFGDAYTFVWFVR